jgi:hypothetical protein
MSAVCCQPQGADSGLSLVLRNPAELGVSERDREDGVIRRPWPTGVWGATEELKNIFYSYNLIWKR